MKRANVLRVREGKRGSIRVEGKVIEARPALLGIGIELRVAASGSGEVYDLLCFRKTKAVGERCHPGDRVVATGKLIERSSNLVELATLTKISETGSNLLPIVEMER